MSSKPDAISTNNDLGKTSMSVSPARASPVSSADSSRRGIQSWAFGLTQLHAACLSALKRMKFPRSSQSLLLSCFKISLQLGTHRFVRKIYPGRPRPPSQDRVPPGPPSSPQLPLSTTPLIL